MNLRLPIRLLALALALMMGGASAHEDVEQERGQGHGDWNDRDDWDDNDEDHDRARRASADGEILTMTELLGRIRIAGRILDTELEHEDGAWIYEIKILDPQGRLYKWVVDAKSGSVLQRRGRD